MGASENKYIKKARKKRIIKRTIFILILVIIALGLLITKSKIFLIKNIEVDGKKLVSKDVISNELQNIKGENIFFVKSDDIKKALKSDPYINEVSISRKFPSTLKVNVTEKNIAYYTKTSSGYDIISSDFVLLEKVNNIKGRKLIELIGLNSDNETLGSKYINTKDDTRLEDFLKELYKINQSNTTKHNITKVNVSNLNFIIVYFGDTEVKVGNGENLVKKMNDALNILNGLEEQKVNIKKGYVDVSFEGAPVIKQGK